MYHVKVDLDIEGTSNQVSGKTLTNVCEASPWDGAYRCSAKVVHQVRQAGRRRRCRPAECHGAWRAACVLQCKAATSTG